MVKNVAFNDRISRSEAPFEKLVRLSGEFQSVLPTEFSQINCNPSSIKVEFESLTLEKQSEYLSQLKTFTELVNEQTERNQNFDRLLIWSIIKRLELRPPSDLFENIASEDYIEIYDRSGIQVFRNLQFCLLVSYSIHDVLFHPWNKLYAREPIYSQQIELAFNRVFDEKKLILNLGIESHLAWQTGSDEERIFQVEMRYFSPLFSRGGAVNYMLAGSKIERLFSRSR